MILAIDPGLSGALVLKGQGVFMHWPMPVFTKIAGARKTDRRFIDEDAVCRLIGDTRVMGGELAVIEDVGGLPGQAAAGAFTFGYGYGVLITACRMHGYPLERVKAAKWKPALRVPADKRAARARASELLPEQSHLWTKSNQDGIAEAAMIALYAERYL
jgi:hypothetical protein